MLNNSHVRPFPPSILSTHIIPRDLITQPTPILPTHLQLPPRTYYPTYEHQFTLWRLIFTSILVRHPIHLSQTYMTILVQYLPNPSPPTSTWAWVSTLNVLESFHFGYCRFRLYNRIPTTLQRDVQMAFHFPLNKNIKPLWCGILAFVPHVTPTVYCFAPFKGRLLNIGKCGFDLKDF
jgi:hypothetical protein